MPLVQPCGGVCVCLWKIVASGNGLLCACETVRFGDHDTRCWNFPFLSDCFWSVRKDLRRISGRVPLGFSYFGTDHPLLICTLPPERKCGDTEFCSL